ncbi:carbohydrate-binding protein (plasmid) [Pedobacter sp. BS3]|uniref:carbohydrate-binding protein n=1 Tax=Pedobacter sp. BS3 TaxID=2567937 RepID=UPI0011EC5501|nr:carbohydrate-binding protein [Pedobacter sp. BS3]TZF86274.1 carbohydrate-binding protein [Pedobacter sp. BS3]
MKKNQRVVALCIMALSISVAVYAQSSHKIEAESFSETSGAARKKTETGTVVNKFDKGKWIRFDKIDFQTGISKIRIKAGSGSSDGKATLEFRTGSETGPLLGKADIKTAGWTVLSEQVIDITRTSGIQDLVVVSSQGGVILDWISLEQ